MKLFVIDKYSVISICLIVVFGTLLWSGAPKSVQTYSMGGRQLPIYGVETEDNAVGITFDTAWGNEDIDEIIAVLESADCKATFFMTGEWIEKFPEDVKKLYDAGHEIANHSESHKHFNSLSEDKMLKEIQDCDDKIKTAVGVDNKIFRAPYGEYNEALVKLCRSTGRYIVQWSLDSLDYKGLTTDQMKQRILPKLRAGDIILFHTGTENTKSALPEILSEMSQKGFGFKKISDLIYHDNFSIDHEGRQHLN